MKTIPNDLLRRLASYDTCTVSNAVEQFKVRTRNEGYMNGGIRCLFPDRAPVVGWAVTATIRTSATPVAGKCYYDRSDFWSYAGSVPAPRFLVIQDLDRSPGCGALFGEVHARIAAALSCVAYATNGAVRDIKGILDSGVQVFAGSVAVSHAYAHIVHFADPVEVAGLSVKSGDLLHGDEHGVLSIPPPIAEQIPAAADRLLQSEKKLIDFCKSANFSLEMLQQHISEAATKSGWPDRDPIQ